MLDVVIEEKCSNCGEHLTLVESVRVAEDKADGTTWLVKRCLHCGCHPVEEVVQLHRDPVKYTSYRRLENEN